MNKERFFYINLTFARQARRKDSVTSSEMLSKGCQIKPLIEKGEHAMKKHMPFKTAIAVPGLLIAGAHGTHAQTQTIQEADTVHIYITERSRGGPRMGVTFILNGELVDGLNDQGVGRTISRFELGNRINQILVDGPHRDFVTACKCTAILLAFS